MIKTRSKTGTVLHECQAPTVRQAVEAAVQGGVSLQHADLRDAELSAANLGDADLREADLTGTNLAGAWLGGARLQGAVLVKAILKGAHLPGAYLGGSDLREADLTQAKLMKACLAGADLEDSVLLGTNLREADLTRAHLVGAIDLDLARHLRTAVLTSIKPDWESRCQVGELLWRAAATTEHRLLAAYVLAEESRPWPETLQTCELGRTWAAQVLARHRSCPDWIQELAEEDSDEATLPSCRVASS